MARNKGPRRRPKTTMRAKARSKAKPKDKAKAKQKAKKRPAARRASRKIARKRAKPVRRNAKALRRKPVRRQAKAANRRRPVARPRSGAPGSRQKPPTARPARRTAKPAAKARPKPAPVPRGARPHTLGRPPLDRERRVLSDEERLELAAASAGSSLTRGPEDRLTSSARTGHDELRAELRLHTESSPTLTAGDVDAKWQDAYAIGDEAPGGDNPTPDQDRVDDIGKALGIVYEDGQELQGGDEVLERDRHRWEFDPASSEDWPHGDKKQ